MSPDIVRADVLSAIAALPHRKVKCVRKCLRKLRSLRDGSGWAFALAVGLISADWQPEVDPSLN